MSRKWVVSLCRSLIPAIAVISLFLSGSASKAAESPVLEWSKLYEGLGTGYSVQQTSDGGYIIGGSNLIKTDTEGNLQWYKPIARSARQTLDGGYIIGCSNVLTKTDSAGTVLWESILAASDELAIQLVRQTADGGYIVLGQTQSYGAGGYDIWLIKTDADGDKDWDTTFGGSANDYGASVQQTTDGGYSIGGSTESYGVGDSDLWLIKTDTNGIGQWNKIFGGSTESEYSGWAEQTSDGGYIIVGTSHDLGSTSDIRLFKTDANGEQQWDRYIGGGGHNVGGSYVEQTSDEGYIILGFDDDTIWSTNDCLWKTDADGYKEWGLRVGDGSHSHRVNAVQQTSDGGYILCGGIDYVDVRGVTLKKLSHLYAPNQPSNVSPLNGATGVSLTPTLQSSAFSDPDIGDTHTASQWQMRTSSGGYSTPLIDVTSNTSLTDLIVPSETLDYELTYYWHVRHQDNRDMWSEWSTETLFTTADPPFNSPPSKPTNVWPGNGATGLSLTSTLQSSAFSDPNIADAHAASQWQVRTVGGGYGSPVYDSGTDGSHLTSIITPSLSHSTTYYWHVRHQDNHGDWSDWSAETFFVTVRPSWDINQDAKVDYKDLAILGAHYREPTSEPYPAWDINQDGKVDYKDLAILGAHYGDVY